MNRKMKIKNTSEINGLIIHVIDTINFHPMLHTWLNHFFSQKKNKP